jgi:hypothetical protein
MQGTPAFMRGEVQGNRMNFWVWDRDRQIYVFYVMYGDEEPIELCELTAEELNNFEQIN